MPSHKKYTNLTIKKRVDHAQAGAERPEREPAVCQTCGAVYRNRRWVRSRHVKEPPKGEHFEPLLMTTCPACAKRLEHLPSGMLYLKGGFLLEHLEEVETALRKEADRAADNNPTARLMEWLTEPDGTVIVSTTTEHLAQRLGKFLHRSFGGEIRYDFSHENKLARVYWQRD